MTEEGVSYTWLPETADYDALKAEVERLRARVAELDAEQIRAHASRVELVETLKDAIELTNEYRADLTAMQQERDSESRWAAQYLRERDEALAALAAERGKRCATCRFQCRSKSGFLPDQCNNLGNDVGATTRDFGCTLWELRQ